MGEVGDQVVLVVEDEVLIRMVVTDLLREAGYRVVEAASGDEATSILASGQRLDLLITDVRMPGDIDGMDLTFQWKRSRPERPAIVVSGHLSQGASYPADLFLSKPYAGDALLAAVERLIGPPCQDNLTNRTAL